MPLVIEFHRRGAIARPLELTPLIDVVFLLLIFFLLTSVFVESGIPLKLPEAATVVAAKEPGIVLSISPNGKVLIHEKEVMLNALDDVLRAAVAQGARARVLIRGDVTARYGVFVEVVDACRAAGVSNVSLAADSLPGPE